MLCGLDVERRFRVSRFKLRWLVMSDFVDSLKRRNPEPPEGQPSSSRQKLDMSEPLDIVADHLDDAAHARMNKDVIDALKDLPFHSTILLATIVSTSEGLDPVYGHIPQAKLLLKKYPALIAKLETAWTKKTFNEIRNLSSWTLCDE